MNKRKRSSKTKSTRKKHSSLPATFFIVITTSVITLLLFFIQTPEWFFLSSGKERIDFTNATGTYDKQKQLAYFLGKSLLVPKEENSLTLANVLGETIGSNKRIEIDLTHQHIYAFENDQKIYDFPVSTGKWSPTPIGEWHIWIKLRYVLMAGGRKEIGTYYYLPNVPFTMFIYNNDHPKWEGYGMHGTYWHNNFGHPMSHGCINMRNEDVEKLYYWATPSLNGQSSITATADNPGTRVVIYGTTPQE